MENIYIESSALLQALLNEEGSESKKQIIDSAKVRLASVLTFLECRRSVRRLLSQNELNERDAREVLGAIESVSASCLVMSVTQSIVSRASDRFPIEPIRTLDAMHLATALEFSATHKNIHILSSDTRIIENLKLLGLSLAQ